MKIYNTFTKTKEDFQPINPPNVTMYMCGPTVYNYFHIGNARSFVMADIVRRYLEFKGFNVKFIMNITDVDDNIIKKANEEKKSTTDVASFYTEAFFEDVKRLKIKTASVYPKATLHISEMIEVIKELEKKGFAYNVNGNVFYDVSKFSSYGKLSGKNTEDLESGARVDVNEEKKNPLDFALWKKVKESEPSWDSPWGKGRPGWHIECSAMSIKHLGKSIDIHAGGNDLIFPHHENEIAQSEACFEQKFVKYWLHFGFLNIQNEKMSKSLGNFFTAREVLDKYSAEAIRLFFAQTNYGGPLNFSDELLNSAQKGYEKILNLAEKIEREINLNTRSEIIPDFDVKKYYSDFEKVMDDDFNSPQAAAVIFDFIRAANKIIAENNNIDSIFYQGLKQFLKNTAENVLGIIHFGDLANALNPNIDNEQIEMLIKKRDIAKKEKNFALADQIRTELSNLGVILQDSKTGTTFKKIILK
ncbi:MAG: cysteine--tRNA ligase [Ignavibacteriales bacterium]|nr:cysteine--tRNA ligase [Ignavibacteriales bacterium]